jgi:hypothetical protein
VGRASFTVALPAAFGCVLAAGTRPRAGSRWRACTKTAAVVMLALLTSMLSPVAGLFLAVAAAALGVCGHRRQGLYIGLAAAVTLSVTLAIPGTGRQPIGIKDLAPPGHRDRAVLAGVPCQPGPPPVGGRGRRHHLAVLTVDRVGDGGHRLCCQQGTGHPQRVIDGLFGFEQRFGAFELPATITTVASGWAAPLFLAAASSSSAIKPSRRSKSQPSTRPRNWSPTAVRSSCSISSKSVSSSVTAAGDSAAMLDM